MQGATHNMRSSSSDNIDFNKLKIVIRNNWYWIVFIFIAVNAGAYLFIRYTKNIYESEDITYEDIQAALKPLQQSLFDVTQAIEKYSQVERVKQKPSDTLS